MLKRRSDYYLSTDKMLRCVRREKKQEVGEQSIVQVVGGEPLLAGCITMDNNVWHKAYLR